MGLRPHELHTILKNPPVLAKNNKTNYNEQLGYETSTQTWHLSNTLVMSRLSARGFFFAI